MKIYREKIHPTNPNMQWVERWGSAKWEVKPCLNNDLPDLPLVTEQEHKIWQRFTKSTGKIVHRVKKDEEKTKNRNEKIKSKH